MSGWYGVKPTVHTGITLRGAQFGINKKFVDYKQETEREGPGVSIPVDVAACDRPGFVAFSFMPLI